MPALVYRAWPISLRMSASTTSQHSMSTALKGDESFVALTNLSHDTMPHASERQRCVPPGGSCQCLCRPTTRSNHWTALTAAFLLVSSLVPRFFLACQQQKQRSKSKSVDTVD